MIDVLIVEDHRELAELIQVFLKKACLSSRIAKSGEEALDLFAKEKCKLILLDINLPGMDGFAVLDSIRRTFNIPILILSARVDKEDQLNGFLGGADDYIEKPVDMDLLTAKIKALIKRNYKLKQESNLLCSGPLIIDQTAHEVRLHEHLLVLTTKEYELLELLLLNSGKVLRKDYLFSKVWGLESESEDQTLTVHIKMLRNKIEDDPKHPKRIVTVWGVGYRYEEI